MMEPLTETEALLMTYGWHTEDCQCIVRVDEGFWATMSENSRKQCTCGWRELYRSLDRRDLWLCPAGDGAGI